MANSRRPVLIDVAGGDERRSLPGAVWLPGAGVCDRDSPSIQARFEARMAELTGNDKARPVVVFCVSQNCWLSYNAAIRLVRAGYTDVAWFRDGTDGYARAGGRLERAARGW
jgi:PQQ-dependent catabolism-associated CXXCW motif protein